jgi:hypothetical protein
MVIEKGKNCLFNAKFGINYQIWAARCHKYVGKITAI